MLRSLICALAVTACSLTAVSSVGAQTLPDDIAKSKVLRVALNAGYPPLEMRDPATNEFVPFASTPAVVAAVRAGEVERGCVPVENSV